ncbi:MAG: hypothetical protein AAGA11_06220 [Pseudomonadota bacterium]
MSPRPLLPDTLGATARRIGLGHYPGVRQFVVQHLYPDTLRLLLLLHAHVPIDCVIGIGYSGNAGVVDALRHAGIRVLTPRYDELEHTVQTELVASLARCRAAGHELMLHEVGGYSIQALHTHATEHLDRVVGAIEVTKQGVWVAEALPRLRIPQLNCAQTRLKQVEGKLVGEAVVAAFDVIARDLGLALTGRQARLSGYGWVGKGAAEALRVRGVAVTVHDTDPVKAVNAAVDGFQVRYAEARVATSLGAPAIALGTSGQCSIDRAVLATLPDGCFLVSGASKDHEIDLAALADATGDTASIHPHVVAHTLHDGRTLYLVNGGFPVNFTGSSVPDEIVEFLFAELIMLVPELLDTRPPPGVYPLPDALEAVVADIWLTQRQAGVPGMA